MFREPLVITSVSFPPRVDLGDYLPWGEHNPLGELPRVHPDTYVSGEKTRVHPPPMYDVCDVCVMCVVYVRMCQKCSPMHPMGHLVSYPALTEIKPHGR